MSTASIGDASVHSSRVGGRDYGPGRSWLLQEITEQPPGRDLRGAIRSDPALGALSQPAGMISTVTCVAPDTVRSVSNGAPGADVATAPSTVTV